MNQTRYVLSFSAGGLLYHESIVVAETYAECRDWEKVVQTVTENNLLQSRVESTTVRKLREICFRLQELTSEQLDLLANGSRSDQLAMLWLACCKRYQLLAEFAREVLREKFLRLDFTITTPEIGRFLETKAVWHEEIEKLKESTRTKLVTVMRRMLREAELVSEEDVIKPLLMSPELVRVIAGDSMEHFQLFPVAESDLRGAMG